MVYNAHGMVLDVDQPSVARGRPVVVFVHGGGWIDNNKDWAIEYAAYFAEHDVTAITFNYRLAPRSKFPAAINDTRDAIAWAQTIRTPPTRPFSDILAFTLPVMQSSRYLVPPGARQAGPDRVKTVGACALIWDAEVIRPRSQPLVAAGGIAVLRGNLAPAAP